MAAPRKSAPANPIGRPPKYTEEWISEEAKALHEFVAGDKGIYLGSFARQRGYGRQRLTEFEKKSVEFADAMEIARLWQEEKFLTKALTKEWDSAQVRHTMARVCGPEWKISWDQPEERNDIPTTVIINKIDK